MSKVFIGAGHGGTDSGAVANGLIEKNVNLIMALAMKAELERHGVEAGISRLTDTTIGLAKEIEMCNAFKPDVAVECHNNAGGGKGFEIYQQQTGIYAAGSMKLASCIEAQIKAIDQNSRGIKGEKSPGGYIFGWLSGCNCPAVLCEGAFLDNKDDYLMIATESKQQAFGVAYAKGILKYLGINWKPSESVLYGVVRQVIALSNRGEAEKYAAAMNVEDEEAYYKVIEIHQ